MTNEDQKAVTSSVIKVIRASGLSGLYERLTPRVRRGNQPDMPIVTTNRVWFLRENQFLVFTRGGPVELTLKPSLVLTGVLICMVGVAAIFYSTIFTSYSAIEVIREETTKTAQASLNSKDDAAFGKVDTAAVALERFDYTPTTFENSHPPSITRKIAHPPSLIIGRIITPPAVTTPRIPQTSLDTKFAADTEIVVDTKFGEDTEIVVDTKFGEDTEIAVDAKIVANDSMPMIIQGGKRVTLASNTASAEPQFGDDAKNIANKPTANDALLPVITPIIAEKSLIDQKMIEQTVIEKSFITEIDTEQTDAKKADINLIPASNPIIENNAKLADITAHAQEFTIALLPNFTSASKDRRTAKIQPDENNDDVIDAALLSPPSPNLPLQPAKVTATLPTIPGMPQADGLLTGFFTQRQGPVLPLVTEAARTKKMLLALEQEIEYIRATVTGLGISAEALPSHIQLSTIAKDNDFKDMMVNLAEHRAALRKIPFKPPMLYFYISSDYGKRKHPKTGKVTFHHGVDLAGTWQENVRVAAPGTVIYAGTEGSFGKVVRVQHDFGIVTTYAHLARITVRLGDYIGENHVIGKMGNTGRSAGAHLHYEIRVNDKSIDPVKFMTVGRQISVAGELRQSNLVD